MCTLQKRLHRCNRVYIYNLCLPNIKAAEGTIFYYEIPPRIKQQMLRYHSPHSGITDLRECMELVPTRVVGGSNPAWVGFQGVQT